MRKANPSDKNAQQSPGKTPPAGRRSGKGSSSVLPYLNEALSSRPVPLEPEDEAQQPPVKRSRWRW
jgi:hypothetical protein